MRGLLRRSLLRSPQVFMPPKDELTLLRDRMVIIDSMIEKLTKLKVDLERELADYQSRKDDLQKRLEKEERHAKVS